MGEYEQIGLFSSLYKAHKRTRRGKSRKTEMIRFEMNMPFHFKALREALQNGLYSPGSYYAFSVYEPKKRTINALSYRDRVVQHSLCDEALASLIEPRLIYDNAACRLGKGTHFAIYRLSLFMRKFYRQYGCQGYFLKCDIRHFFASIDHQVLKERLSRLPIDDNMRCLLDRIIDSYEDSPGCGLPLGNQSSQWFALYYLDGFDRIIKEKYGIKYYSRYMDDCIVLHHNKNFLRELLQHLQDYLQQKLHLQFNAKTQILPIKNGVEYLGFRFKLTASGKVLRVIKPQAKRRLRRHLRSLYRQHEQGLVTSEALALSLNSVRAHLDHGHHFLLKKRWLNVLSQVPPKNSLQRISS